MANVSASSGTYMNCNYLNNPKLSQPMLWGGTACLISQWKTGVFETHLNAIIFAVLYSATSSAEITLFTYKDV